MQHLQSLQLAEIVGLRLLLVPGDRIGEITAMLELGFRLPSPASATKTVFDEVFIPDPEDDR